MDIHAAIYDDDDYPFLLPSLSHTHTCPFIFTFLGGWGQEIQFSLMSMHRRTAYTVYSHEVS